MTDNHVVHGCPTCSRVLWAGSVAAHVIITVSGKASWLNCYNFCSIYIYIYIYIYIFITDVAMDHITQPSGP